MEQGIKKIRMLEIVFAVPLKSYEIAAFRGAVANKVGQDSVLFHNHTDVGFRYDYPLIQYKLLNRNASIICIEDGVDEIYHLFNTTNHTINIGRDEYELKIEKLSVNTYNVNVWDNKFTYSIANWLALNEENYEKFTNLESLADKFILLENILTANILSFFKGIELYLPEDKKVEVKITEMTKEKRIKFKGTSRLAFDLRFKTNVSLPSHIGLGKAPSHGYGVVYKVKQCNDATMKQ